LSKTNLWADQAARPARATGRPKSGDLLIYCDRMGTISHVAVVISHEPDLAKARWKTTVISQWGFDGEYVHDHADVNQLLGRPDRFYSEKKRSQV
jgi:hypothetical protein